MLEQWKESEEDADLAKDFEIKVVEGVNVVVEDESEDEDEEEPVEEDDEEEEPVREEVVDDLVEGLVERWNEGSW